MIPKRNNRNTLNSARGFSPRQLGQLTKWLSWADATDSGTLVVPDRLGGNSATQSSGVLKPTLSLTDNGVRVATFSAHLLSLPLSAAINDNLKFGVAFWVKLANVSGLKTFASVQVTAGGASANKLLVNTFGATFEARAQAVDRRAGVSALDATNWRFCYLGIDCSKGTEATRVIMGLDGRISTVAFSSDTAWPTSLGTPTGNMLIGATTLGGASPLVGTIGDIYFFSDQLSAADVAQLMAFNRPLVLPLTGNIVALGNSITEGAGLTATQNYPAVLRSSLGNSWQVFNCGHSSWTTTQLHANFAEVQSHFAAQTTNNILVVNEIGNELDQGVSEASARANMQALIATGRANGWRVMFATTPPRDAAHFSPAQTLASNNINAYFRNNPAEHDGLIDWAADPSLDDPTDLTWYQDGVHPTAAGAAVIAALTAAAI